jgi:hypothetical protein
MVEAWLVTVISLLIVPGIHRSGADYYAPDKSKFISNGIPIPYNIPLRG